MSEPYSFSELLLRGVSPGSRRGCTAGCGTQGPSACPMGPPRQAPDRCPRLRLRTLPQEGDRALGLAAAGKTEASGGSWGCTRHATWIPAEGTDPSHIYEVVSDASPPGKNGTKYTVGYRDRNFIQGKSSYFLQKEWKQRRKESLIGGGGGEGGRGQDRPGPWWLRSQVPAALGHHSDTPWLCRVVQASQPPGGAGNGHAPARAQSRLSAGTCLQAPPVTRTHCP